MKRYLNLGAGNRLMYPLEEWINHDRVAHRPEINAVWDLDDYPWPWADNQFEIIVAFDVLEHTLRPVRFIEEVWRIAAPNAKISIHTCWAGPSVEAREVWRDPTHTRPFHELSFHYFDPVNGGFWYENYGRFYSSARFLIEQISTEPPDNILFELIARK